MCLAKIVFAVFAWTTVANYVFVSGQAPKDEVLEPSDEKTEPPPVENHTFVALIDIFFVDGSNRQCTGTILHDNVVVTAAHCLLNHGLDIELSNSFVVIGTKKMFDTGYENYLPIERIITHPRYKGWTADLALVFTFAGMTTDKAGYAIPLIAESATTPVDANVTVLSWGRCADDDKKEKNPGTRGPGEKKRRCTSSEEENESCEPASTYKPLRQGHRSSEHERSSEAVSSQHRAYNLYKSDVPTVDLARVTSGHNTQRVLGARNMKKPSQDNSSDELNNSNEPQWPHEPLEPQLNVTMGLDKQIMSIEGFHVVRAEVKKKEKLTKALRRLRKHHKLFRNSSIVNVKDQKSPKAQTERRSGRNTTLDGKTAIQSYYKDWRRQDKMLSTKENILTVETFGFVNVQSCKKLVDKVKSQLYRINTNEVVCYAADEHYISDDDSGAPAIRQGHLVAVTVGGVECDGDHVAIGMKINCFCAWIAENLPEANVDWKCCKDCCSGDEPKKSGRQRHKNE